jgi:hypothetical protein
MGGGGNSATVAPHAGLAICSAIVCSASWIYWRSFATVEFSYRLTRQPHADTWAGHRSRETVAEFASEISEPFLLRRWAKGHGERQHPSSRPKGIT